MKITSLRGKAGILFWTIFAVSLPFCIGRTGVSAEEAPSPKVMNFIAVMDLKCGAGIQTDVCHSLTDVIINGMVGVGTYTVIDRANRDKILAEQGFQQGGCVDDSCTVDAGRLLGVGKIVVGSITKIGETYLINLQLVNVQTAAVETSTKETCRCELDGLITACENAARRLMGTETPQPAPQAPQTQPAPAAQPVNLCYYIFSSYSYSNKSKASAVAAKIRNDSRNLSEGHDVGYYLMPKGAYAGSYFVVIGPFEDSGKAAELTQKKGPFGPLGSYGVITINDCDGFTAKVER